MRRERLVFAIAVTGGRLPFYAFCALCVYRTPEMCANAFPVTVMLAQTGERFAGTPDQSLLVALLRGKANGFSGCLNGGCGMCKVRVLRGEIHRLGPISRAHVSVSSESIGYSLACRAAPQSDVEVEVIGSMWKRFLGVRPGMPDAELPVLQAVNKEDTS